ncbi:MAG TPA: FtsX-like permease family protein [Kofleriaceae bacterium]|nr:FtsX-like permease family protein [Kofleriaceae bacterium]
MLQIRPILSTLRRHRTAAALIVLEISLTCAIVCNALFLINERLTRMSSETGIAEDEIVRVQITGIGTDVNATALTKEDLASLAAIPGVRGVAMTNQIPYGGSSWNSSVNLEPHQMHQTLSAATYYGTEQLVETLGVQIVAGRDFNPDEYVNWEEATSADPKLKAKLASIIVSRRMAEKLFPGRSPLGGVVYMGEEPLRVVGVIEQLARPNDFNAATGSGFSAILPIWLPYTIGGNYILRVDPDRRSETLVAAVSALERNSPNRIILDKKDFETIRSDYYRADRSMAWLLVAVCIALLVITALGIVGLASFWVQQRTRQIGIRRALGATRGQILRYFQTENFLLATIGIVLGMALAYGINFWLMKRYELPRLPILFLPFGALSLWALGQLAVLGPAKRAAAVPPAVATRTV